MASRPDSRDNHRRSLRGHGSFRRAYRTGTRRRCGAISAIVATGPAGPPTVGFVCSKKVGKAVVRNRAKRRMRAAASRCVLRSDTVYILVADRGVIAADFEQLISWIDRCTADPAEER
ncbi:MAG: ribonuclease P protein component [bacterium]|nr:ribonuclease P protein component [bacterium]